MKIGSYFPRSMGMRFAMKSKFILLSLLSSLLLPISASATVDYNIAKGLAPTSKDQSISVLKPFKGDFRILGSKMYSDDAQAKFSPIDYAVSWGLFVEPEIAKQIKHVKRGDLVRIKGELVEIKDKDMVWTSSLTPTDTGDGACEVFRVNSIQWIERRSEEHTSELQSQSNL